MASLRQPFWGKKASRTSQAAVQDVLSSRDCGTDDIEVETTTYVTVYLGTALCKKGDRQVLNNDCRGSTSKCIRYARNSDGLRGCLGHIPSPGRNSTYTERGRDGALPKRKSWDLIVRLACRGSSNLIRYRSAWPHLALLET